jgi:hypothetical protein
METNAVSSVKQTECCSQCGGAGEVSESVMGQSGLVACDACDNIPESAIPADPPADPEARLDEIAQAKRDLAAEREQLDELREKVAEARELLKEVADADVIGDEGETILRHIASEIRRETDRTFDMRYVDFRNKQLSEEQRQLRRFVEAIQSRQEGNNA